MLSGPSPSSSSSHLHPSPRCCTALRIRPRASTNAARQRARNAMALRSYAAPTPGRLAVQSRRAFTATSPVRRFLSALTNNTVQLPKGQSILTFFLRCEHQHPFSSSPGEKIVPGTSALLSPMSKDTRLRPGGSLRAVLRPCDRSFRLAGLENDSRAFLTFIIGSVRLSRLIGEFSSTSPGSGHDVGSFVIAALCTEYRVHSKLS